MLPEAGSFPAEYDAEIADAPSAGEVDRVFTDGSRGARTLTVSVAPRKGPPWTGGFTAAAPLNRHAASGLFGTPSPTTLCVVERGTAFLVDVNEPARYQVVPTEGEVVVVEQAAGESLLLLVTPWSITAVGSAGVAWTSPRIAVEAVQVDEVGGGWLRGVADPDEEPRNFAVDLATGRLVGGVGFKMRGAP